MALVIAFGVDQLTPPSVVLAGCDPPVEVTALAIPPNNAPAGAAIDVHVAAKIGNQLLGGVSFNVKKKDCNGNTVDDYLDIRNGTSSDVNGNGVPDECDLFPVQYDASSAGVGDVPAAIAVADTFPGALVAVARLGDDSVRLFSEVAGVLTPGAIVPVGARPEAVLAGRLRAVIVVGGDLPDLVTANANDGTVSILSEGLGGTYADITGSPFAFGGANTFRYRQSSSPRMPSCGASLMVRMLSTWAHACAYFVAASTSARGFGGSGGFHLSSPIGGCAKGMPSHAKPPCFDMPPTTSPSVVWRRVSTDWVSMDQAGLMVRQAVQTPRRAAPRSGPSPPSWGVLLRPPGARRRWSCSACGS